MSRVISQTALRLLYRTFDLVSLILYPFRRLRKIQGTRILCYHRVYDLPVTKDSTSSLCVSPAMFDRQMEFLFQKGFHQITLSEYLLHREEGIDPPAGTIVITFDDGYRDNLLNALPILKKYNFQPTVFIATRNINDKAIFSWLKIGQDLIEDSRNHSDYWIPLTEEDIRNMDVEGVDIGSHTVNHQNLTTLNPEEVVQELTQSKERLENLLGKPILICCYPYGGVDSNVAKLTKDSGYKASTGLTNGINTSKTDLLNLYRTSISGHDSFFRFKRKIYGTYDWTDGFLTFLSGIIHR